MPGKSKNELLARAKKDGFHLSRSQYAGNDFVIDVYCVIGPYQHDEIFTCFTKEKAKALIKSIKKNAFFNYPDESEYYIKKDTQILDYSDLVRMYTRKKKGV